jgi:predicted aspartyl protease
MTPVDLSRRALLGAIPALGLAGPAMGQATGTRIIPPEPVEEEPSTLDAWVDKYGRPTAKVILNGRGPYSFMVDTGSTTTVLAARHVERLGVPVVGTATVAGTTGMAEAELVRLDTLETGVVKKSDIRLAVLPDIGLARADGILGADVFAGRKLVFDIASHVVRVESSRRQVRLSPRGNMRVRNGLLAEIDGFVGSIRTKLMLDTGAEHCIANRPLQRALGKSHPRLPVYKSVRVIGVTGHVLVGDFIELPRIDLREFAVKDAGAVAADAPIFHYWGLTDEPAMIVGVNVLSRLAGFSIDYGARTFDAELMALIARNRNMMG